MFHLSADFQIFSTAVNELTSLSWEVSLRCMRPFMTSGDKLVDWEMEN